jgi:hypothetical protein
MYLGTTKSLSYAHDNGEVVEAMQDRYAEERSGGPCDYPQVHTHSAIEWNHRGEASEVSNEMNCREKQARDNAARPLR